MSSLIPPLPMPPLGLPDPLRRIHVPRDLGSVTDTGPEAPPAAGDVTSRHVEAIWSSVLDWYRSGVHPALQVCVRRHGAVILNRAIGHSRGNGPQDGRDAQRVPVSVDTPSASTRPPRRSPHSWCTS